MKKHKKITLKRCIVCNKLGELKRRDNMCAMCRFKAEKKAYEEAGNVIL